MRSGASSRNTTPSSSGSRNRKGGGAMRAGREGCGVLANRKRVDAHLFFDIFNPAPFWERVKPIVAGMRKSRPHIYENFERLAAQRQRWTRKRGPQATPKPGRVT